MLRTTTTSVSHYIESKWLKFFCTNLNKFLASHSGVPLILLETKEFNFTTLHSTTLSGGN